MSGGDFCPGVIVKAFVQSNGIIREDTSGRFLGRLDEITYEEVQQYDALKRQNEYRHPIFTIIDAVKNPDAMKIMWAQLGDIGTHNLSSALRRYDIEIQKQWEKAKEEHEKEVKEGSVTFIPNSSPQVPRILIDTTE